MPRSHYTFTSESVSEGHPDKLCDQISDSILDAYLAVDPSAHVACECLATTNRLVIAGEVRSILPLSMDALIDVARTSVRDIGYEQDGFHWERMDVDVLLHAQSTDISMGVDADIGKDEGAGDQGIMFGYACRETDALMPAPIHFAHNILHRLARERKSGALPQLLPDAKSQVSLVYENGKPVRTTAIVVSTQHQSGISPGEIREIIRPHVVASLPEGWICDDAHFYVNPTGRFVIGGPDGDTGLTGRKIIVDTYGGAAPHGGGAFSGKDPSKVDRSASYMARYLAKNVVAADLADRCTIQIAYAIGISTPVAFYINLHDTGRVDEEKLSSTLQDMMDLSPRGIRAHLGLARPIYARTAAYGHFGRPPDKDGGFSWEKTDLAASLRNAFGEK
ncbi:MAG TPA: methionine adenosyltransferase [Rhodospirillaceae bacterium]|nr:MAG: methionine adenosyltransferase [Alphaproteobacteria bacterium GWF2_58_20]HAU28799.1 methionine adenosyltransferase [Rhodospirillaceae bacterium]